MSLAGAKHALPLGSFPLNDANKAVPDKSSTEVPLCLRRLVRTVIRSFYTTEHAIVINILLRNTIMKEEDLCERLKLDKKALRQVLHSLRTDQFIKSRMQLETEAEGGKTNRITHYFIDFKLFVNVVKYRLDMMYRRLEGEQRDSSSRANYKCNTCNSTFTDLEIDRLLDPFTGQLKCTYCNCEVNEQQDSIERVGACAQIIAKFNQQIRAPIDELIRECQQIHLSSAILEPEIRPLEPLPETEYNAKLPQQDGKSGLEIDEEKEKKWAASLAKENDARAMIRVVVDGAELELKNYKERPVWLRESTVDLAGLGSDSVNSTTKKPTVDTVQDLTAGRIPQHIFTSGETGAQIMELLMIHEKRNSRFPTAPSQPMPRKSQPGDHPVTNGHSSSHSTENGDDRLLVKLASGESLAFKDITLDMVKKFTEAELVDFRRVGKLLFQKHIYD